MFWRWFSPWGFMDTEPGHHESQWEALSQRLFALTFWGDYGGNILSRFHYSMLLEDNPLAVQSIEAAHGQGLVLSGYVDYENEAYRDQLREVIRFLAFFDPESPTYGDYPAYDEYGFSDWEYELGQKEMTEGWWGQHAQRELVDYFADWEDNTIVPEVGTEEWGTLVYSYLNRDDDYDYPYWESADSLIVYGWETAEVAEWMLDQYARQITEAGNPETLEVVFYGEPTRGTTSVAQLDWAQVICDTWNDNQKL